LDGASLAKLAWAYASVRQADEGHRAQLDRKLFTQVAAACLQQEELPRFPPRALVALLWSFAALPQPHAPLFDAIAAALVPHLSPPPSPQDPLPSPPLDAACPQRPPQRQPQHR
ncbi:hypothetical protein Agub_g11315, partial [Astrephomene gubernaculifera]